MDNSEILVLIHGYGGTSLTYYRMLKLLTKRYRVYCIDIIGFGLSSRPAFNLTNPIQIIDFFVESIEAWRREMGITKFVLGGHSFGGYLASNYALKYEHHLTTLLLFSPAGASKRSKEEMEEMEQRI